MAKPFGYPPDRSRGLVGKRQYVKEWKEAHDLLEKWLGIDVMAFDPGVNGKIGFIHVSIEGSALLARILKRLRQLEEMGADPKDIKEC